ncbi:uncharacterized protein [Rutidosis leptorrhynchoides]|uniref:uncharacterized protein n=1 Tax=Rutidosis leptorrhynchoides TaxID=125765 RepID=UPI003A9973A0
MEEELSKEIEEMNGGYPDSDEEDIVTKSKAVKEEDTDEYVEKVVEEGTREFLIPCEINGSTFVRALADSGSSVNIMPFSMFDRLKLMMLEPIDGIVYYGNTSSSRPIGIVKNVKIKIGLTKFLVHFIVMDMVENKITPILLGTPFLSTSKAIINYFSNTIIIHQGNNSETLPIITRSKLKRKYNEYEKNKCEENKPKE